MTLVSQIITDAFRATNLIAAGTTPTADEIVESTALLNRFVSSLFGTDMGENLESLRLGRGASIVSPGAALYLDDYLSFYVPTNTRIQCNLTQATSASFDPNPRDGARMAVVDNTGNFATYSLTLKGNGRKIESGQNVTLSTNSLSREWFYRDDIGTWTRLADLTTSDSNPFPAAFDDMLVIGLAIRLVGSHGTPVGPENLSVFNELKKKFKARYRQEAQIGVDAGLVRLSQGYSQNYTASQAMFNNGIIH